VSFGILLIVIALGWFLGRNIIAQLQAQALTVMFGLTPERRLEVTKGLTVAGKVFVGFLFVTGAIVLALEIALKGS
jgi:hypothetical protein